MPATSSSSSMSPSLASRFGIDAASPLVPDLASLLRLYPALDADALFYKWEALSFSAGTVGRDGVRQPLPLNADSVALLKDQCQRDWEASFKGKATPRKEGTAFSVAGPASSSARKGGIGSLLGINVPVTPSPFHRGARPSAPSSAATSNSSASAYQTPVRPSAAAADGDVEMLDSPSDGRTSASAVQPHIAETLNSHIAPSKRRGGDVQTSRVSLAIGTNPKEWDYRYMFERAGKKGEALDERIDELMTVIMNTYGITVDDLADPSVASQESVYVVGRIAPLLEAGSGSRANAPVKPEDAGGDDSAATNDGVTRGMPKLTASNLVLETSKLVGSGSRTRLSLAQDVRLRHLRQGGATSALMPHPAGQGGQVSLIPGMIVGLYGRNVDGGKDGRFRVEEILMPPALPHPCTPCSELMHGQYDARKLAGDAMGLVIASGPFTNDADLEFRPWHRLMDDVERMAREGSAPDVLLLLGPFLTVNHPALLAPGQARLPSEIFRDNIGARLERLVSRCPGITPILLPSTRDIVSGHAAWPQPMLNKQDPELGIPKRAKCLPNPSIFSINEVVIGATTADVLRDVRAEEMVHDVRMGVLDQSSGGGDARDVIARACRQVLHQQSFYPIFPASAATSHPLDVSHARLSSFPNVTPDVLVLPSMLQSFARVVDSTVVVNPGATAKGKLRGAGAGAEEGETLTAPQGSIARLSIAPLPLAELKDRPEEDDEAHRVYERARVDIVKI